MLIDFTDVFYALLFVAVCIHKKCQALFELLLVDNYESFKLTFDEEQRTEHNGAEEQFSSIDFLKTMYRSIACKGRFLVRKVR